MNLRDLLTIRLLTILNPGLEGAIFQILKVVFLLAAIVAGLFFYLDHAKEQEIIAATPMQLDRDEGTGYLVFDVNKQTGFGSIPFLAAIKDHPVILKGGIPVRVNILGSPTVTDSDDKKIKKIEFSPTQIVGYVPVSCLEQLAEANRIIDDKVRALPKGACASAWCGYTSNVLELDQDNYKNKACSGFAVIQDVNPTCEILLTGEIDNKVAVDSWKVNGCSSAQSFLFVLKGTELHRSRELEALQKKMAVQGVRAPEDKRSSAIVENDEFSCLVNPSPDLKSCYNCANPSGEIGRFVCSNPKIAQLDSVLSGLYKNRLANSDNAGPIKADQADWVMSVQQCRDESCVIDAYNRRLSEVANGYK